MNDISRYPSTRDEIATVIAPFSVTRGLNYLYLQFTDHLDLTPETLSRADQVEWVEFFVAQFVARMTQRKMLEELMLLTIDTTSETVLTVEDPTPSAFSPAGWTVRERIADVLADVYRMLLIKLVDASVTNEREPAPAT